jgi:hypothetical protein
VHPGVIELLRDSRAHRPAASPEFANLAAEAAAGAPEMAGMLTDGAGTITARAHLWALWPGPESLLTASHRPAMAISSASAMPRACGPAPAEKLRPMASRRRPRIRPYPLIEHLRIRPHK